MSDSPLRAARLAHVAAAGQAGCWMLVILFAALLIGLWLDGQFGLRGPFTVAGLLISIPISLFVVVRIALGAVKMSQSRPLVNRRHEETLKEEG
ncbi:MAG: AtpZ/AtpI family protein [Aggregatilineales bacterium]